MRHNYRTIIGIALAFAAATQMRVNLAWSREKALNGGDICEDNFKIIRDDIRSWITKGGSAGLVLPKGISLSQYNSAMLAEMSKARISCVDNVITVDGMQKTCENFADTGEKPNIVCNKNRFMQTSDSDQYLLVHHEYAGLAGFEVNDGPSTLYVISNQISGYLADEVVKKLVVNQYIPVAAGHEIVRQDGENAMVVCFGIGDPQRSIRSVMQSLSAEIYPGQSLTTGADPEESTQILAASGPGAAIWGTGKVLVGDAVIGATLTTFMTSEQKPVLYGSEFWKGGSSDGPRGKEGAFHMTLNPGLPLSPLSLCDACSNFQSSMGFGAYYGAVEVVASGTLPRIVYDSLVDERDYDSWGRPQGSRFVMQNPRIEAPSDLNQPLIFKNTTFNGIADIMIDQGEYAQCLQDLLVNSIAQHGRPSLSQANSILKGK